MRLIDRPIRLQWTDCDRRRRPEPVEQLDALRVKIDQRYVLLRRDGARLLRVAIEIVARGAPHQRRDQDRHRAGGARLVDVARHVRAERREVGLAVESLSGDVVVPELNEDVCRLMAKQFLPMPFGGVALRAPSAAGRIEKCGALFDIRFEAAAVARLLRHRGVAGEGDANCPRVGAERPDVAVIDAPVVRLSRLQRAGLGR